MTPDKKRPMPMMLASFLMVPALMGSMIPIVALLAAQKANVPLNYSFAWTMLGAAFALSYAIVIRLTHVAETYIWEYLALCKFLKTKGLQSWIDEAQKIRSLK